MLAELPRLQTVKRLMAGGTAVACVWAAAGARADASEIGLADRTALTFGVSGVSR